MRKTLIVAAVAACAFASTAGAATQGWFGFPIDYHRAPPPPRVVITTEPRIEVLQDIGIVNDPHCNDDMFRYHDSWYVARNNYWYRSANWRGPWTVVDVRTVPRPIFDVPRERWHHHPLGGPPGQMKKLRREERREDRRDDRHDDHGRGHGKGHDKDDDNQGHGHGNH